MRDKVIIGQRGTITLPARMREAFGLKPNDELIVESTDQGLLLRPAVSVPIEIYSEKRIAEFSTDEQAVGSLLDKSGSHGS